MLRSPRLLVCALLLVVAYCAAPQNVSAQSVGVNTSTMLMDGSFFTAGTTYYAAFQLTGGGTNNNSAALSSFNFGGGSALPRAVGDQTDPTFTLGPNPLDSNGIGQAGATLGLTITPADAFSLYSQMFTAGSSFSFNLALTNNFTPGNAPDAFTFQLYDAALDNLLFEQTINITGIPEPTTLLLTGISLAFAGVAVVRRHRRREVEDESAEA